MKERIEFATEATIRGRKGIVNIMQYVYNFNFDCVFERNIEQIPETFEELQELCRKLKIDCEVYITLPLTNKMKLYFYDNGEIICAYLDFEYEFSLAKNRTPAQMWNIVKSLVGASQPNGKEE